MELSMKMKRTKTMMRKACGCMLALVVLLALGMIPASAAGEKTAAPTGTALTLEDAKALALEMAQLEEDGVLLTKLAIDRDDGRTEYEIEFLADGMAYEYEISADTGKVLKVSTGKKAGEKWSAFESGQYLTMEEAKEKALAAAGVTAAEAVFTEVQIDFDDGRAEYDVGFTVGNQEYDLELDAATGEVLKQEMETAREGGKKEEKKKEEKEHEEQK